MEGISTAQSVAEPYCRWTRWLNVLALTALWLWQGWMTVQLFGTVQPWDDFTNDEPILSGRHPLHLYHGFLGARSLWETGKTSCYDPAFQAGYPKTPVYDSGSRPAELFLTLSGGQYSPAAYKFGFAICCLAAPGFLIFAARMMELCRSSSVLATTAGLFVWWSVPGQQLLENGDLELLLAGLAALMGSTLLVRFDLTPSFWVWTGIVTSGTLGWFAQPFVLMLLFPVLLVYYLSVGNRHRLFWHASLFVGLLLPLMLNSFWLVTLFTHWWIRSPLTLEVPLLPHRTLHSLWTAPLWGETPDRFLELVLIGFAGVGIVILNETRRRTTARLLGLGSGGFLALALLGVAWEPLGRLGTPKLLVPALWFAILPAGFALAELLRRVSCKLNRPRWQIASAGSLVVLGLLAMTGQCKEFLMRALGTAPLTIGLAGPERAMIDSIRAHTTQESRILWENCAQCPSGSQWTALLPFWTERSFIGGLDPEACIEHTQACLQNGYLAGRRISQWNDIELADYCKRYNVGWLVCWSAEAQARFQSWPGAQLIATDLGDEHAYLFRLVGGSFVLKGQATLQKADSRYITLTEVVPEQGVVVLSMHYQTGLHVLPSRVLLEKEPNPRDPIPFIRLRMSEPLARVTLIWDAP